MSPTQLVQHAIINGVTTLAITDHDTIVGWEEASRAIRGELELVLGAEISCQSAEHRSVHILALLFDGRYQPLQEILAASRDDRIPRMKKMVQLMAADGIDISYEEVLAQKDSEATLGRPHLADALVAKGIVKSRDIAFAELLNNDSKYYVSHISPTPIEAIKSIKEAGGVSIIAHPYASFRGLNLTHDLLNEFKSAGLNGIEVDHRDHNLEERMNLREIAADLDLVTTGSSDFHGSGKLNLIAENVTAPEHWLRLESMANARRVVRK